MHGPSVVVLGYQPRINWNSSLYCSVTLPDGSSVCLPKKTIVKHQCECNGYLHHVKYEAVDHICVLNMFMPVPVLVRLSSYDNCFPATQDIEVHNFRPKKKRKFGVCVQVPVNGYMIDYSDILNFIEMNRVFGAEIITLYSAKSYLRDLTYLYRNVLDYVPWPNLPLDSHYWHGQIMTMHDCLYRNMHRVDYLFFIDLDELVVPNTPNVTWSTIIDTMNNGINDTISAYIFNNVYYSYEDENTSKPLINLCDQRVKAPKYFTHLRRHLCKYHHYARSKAMVKPLDVLQMDIHSMCRGLHSKAVAPHSLASLHHYRVIITDDCKSQDYTIDTGIMKYKDQLVNGLKETLCPNYNHN